MDDKIYYPETIPDTPLPLQVPQNVVATAPGVVGSNGVASQSNIQDTPPPKKVIAHETISSALNTKSRNILKEFQLTEQGGIKIGELVPGLNGDIRITPAGIVARDSAGNITVAIDGETGNAVFRGEIFGGSIDINNQFAVDEDGNVTARSISLFETASTTVSAGLAQKFTVVGTYADVSGASFSITVVRPTLLLFLVTCRAFIYKDSGGAGDWSGQGTIALWKDASEIYSGMTYTAESVGSDDVGDEFLPTYAMHHVVTVNPGTYTFKLRGVLSSSLNGGALQIYHYNFSMINLGGVLS